VNKQQRKQEQGRFGGFHRGCFLGYFCVSLRRGWWCVATLLLLLCSMNSPIPGQENPAAIPGRLGSAGGTQSGGEGTAGAGGGTGSLGGAGSAGSGGSLGSAGSAGSGGVGVATGSGGASELAGPLSAAGGVVGGVGSELFLRTEGGRLIPLRELLSAEAVSRLLTRAGEQQLPGYWIARLELQGRIEGEVLELDLELQVVVRAVSEWVSVPLVFGDVFLTDFEHESGVAGAESVLQSGEQNSRRWSLRGAGLHRLKLHLSGRTRTASPGIHQLNLQLPESAASHAMFEFTGPVEMQKLPDGAVDRQTRDERGVRKVEFVGISGAATMSWREVSPPVAVKPVVQVQNRMKLDLTTIPASLTGTLELEVTGSPLSEVVLTWPEGFEMNEVQARNGSRSSVMDHFEQGREAGSRETKISLTSAVEGELTIEYDLELSNRSFPQDIRVSLPLVRDANVQTGDVELIFPAGMLVQQLEIVGAQRRRVTAETDSGAAATAFRLRSRESFIRLHLDEMAAQYAVTTELGIRPQGGSVLLTGQVRVSVLRGALPELLLDWTSAVEGSGWSAWSLLPGAAKLVRSGRTIPLSPELTAGSPGELKFVFPERQSGEFLLEFQAVSELSAAAPGEVGAAVAGNEERRLLLQCPQVQSRRGQPVVLRTEESDEYEAELLLAGGGERLRGVPATSSLSAGLSGLESGGVGAVEGAGAVLERGLSWIHENPSEPVWIRLMPQRQTIRASVTAGLVAVDRGVEVREKIELDVMHRDITEVTLLVPATVQPVVRVAGVADPLRAVIGKSNEWTFRLPQATRGTLVLEVRWLKAAAAVAGATAGSAAAGVSSAGDVEDWNIELVVPRDARIWRVLAGTSDGGLEVREGSGWEPVYSESYTSAWRNLKWGGESAIETGDLAVPLRSRRGAFAGSGIGPVLVQVESRLFPGQSLTSCRWYFEGRPERMVLEVPAGLLLESIELCGESLSGRTGVLQAERGEEGVEERWEILPEVLGGLDLAAGVPVVLEVRLRQELGVSTGLRGAGEQLRAREIRRVRLRGETKSATLIWLLRPQTGLRAVTSEAPLASLSPLPGRVFGSDSGARAVSLRQLEAILSAFPEGIRSAARERGVELLEESGGHDLCLGSGEDGAVRVSLVPQSLLMLVPALICLVVFVLLTWLWRLPLGLPIPLAAAGLTGLWVALPDWAALLIPWSAGGVLAGVVAAGLQRWSLVRRYGVVSLRRVTERPTVFGFPDYADSGLRSLRGASGGSAGGQSEAAGGVV